ncbi:MAG: SUF system FeS assembly protein, NifU family [Microgenomates group bacterium GW2011_GWF2_47_9]|nr:MAG: SUF system FeS assembly protein, NifU family [Microgenomates group bacterium GW2011_GWF2_47_9]
MDIYAEEVMDHYEQPRNQGELEGNDVRTARDANASCGDMIQFFIKTKAGRVIDVKWKGIGCAISVAGASKLSEYLQGQSLGDLARMSEAELVKAIGFQVNPGRMKCLTLPIRVVQKILES